MIIANHVSYLDILILSALRPSIFLAKREVSKWPLFGWVAQSLGCIFVQRDSLMGRANALRACLRASSGSDIALFPEGTTTSSPLPELNKWAKGHAWLAQKAHADAILCLGLSYENQAQRAWIDDDALLPHLFRTLCEKKIRVKVAAVLVEVVQNMETAQLAAKTHHHLCLAVSNDCLG